MAWRWNSTAYRYQWVNGSSRFLSRNTVLGWIEESLATSVSVSDTLSEMVANGLISPADWHNVMREQLKYEYIRQYLLGYGGYNRMDARGWGSIGGMLSEQYGYLGNFLDDIASGNLTEGQIRARAAMYFNSSREAYERAHERVAREWGADEEAWNLGVADHCDDCVVFSEMGYQPIEEDAFGGAYPGSGATTCLTNCHCYKSYRNSRTGESFEG